MSAPSNAGAEASPAVLEKLRNLTMPPIAALLGFELLSVEPGESTFGLEVDERLSNPQGTLHGGVLCDLADAAMGIAFASLLSPGETYTTIELKINFLKPVWKTRLTASGRVLRKGRSVGLALCDVVDSAGNLVAHASSTCMVLAGDQAQGR